MARKNKFTRRGFLPILGGSLLLPFMGEANPIQKNQTSEDYEILLRPDGTPVKVKKDALKNAQVVKIIKRQALFALSFLLLLIGAIFITIRSLKKNV